MDTYNCFKLLVTHQAGVYVYRAQHHPPPPKILHTTSRKKDFLQYTSGDENHLCRASLHESHKISLKAHRHAHGVAE